MLLKNWLARFQAPSRHSSVTRRQSLFSFAHAVEQIEQRLLPAATTFGQYPGYWPPLPSQEFGGKFVEWNGNFYFSYGRIIEGMELWKTDGTPAGTVVVKDLHPGSNGSSPNSLTAISGGLLFFATDPVLGKQLFKTDGTAAGTIPVKAIQSRGDFDPFLGINNTLFFVDGTNMGTLELYKSDGTTAGTTVVKEVRPGPNGSNPKNLTNFNGILYFSADDGVHGTELWRSDGTEAGTYLLKDITPGGTSSNSNLTDFKVFEGKLYFKEDGVWYQTDGTESGTILAPSVPLGLNPALEYTPGAVGIYYYANGRNLVKSDGVTTTILRTAAVNEFHANLVYANGTLYFAAKNENGVELWKSDGTPGGTVMLKDIRPGSGSFGVFSSYPCHMKVIGNTVYFAANDGTNGFELWKTDGTSEGTVLVKNIAQGDWNSYPVPVIEINGKLLFRTYNDSSTPPQYWGTDGTTGGTSLLINSNLAPNLNDAGNPALTPIPQDISNSFNTGTLVSTIITRMAPGGIVDSNPGDAKGIAVIAADQRFGTWQYSPDGITWSNLGAVSVANARLLASDGGTCLRFVPAPGFNGIARITFKAWDRTSGVPTGTADTTQSGGDTAFSVDFEEARIVVGTPNKVESFGVYRNGTFYLDANRNRTWNGTSGDSTFGFASASDVPVTGDWDGDGRTDIGIFRNGAFYLDANGSRTWDGAAGGDAIFNFGTAGDIPVTGDWNGDGKTDVGIWRNGSFYLDINGNRRWDNLSGGDTFFGFGGVNDTPISGDWNGDGRGDIGVYRGGTFYLDQSGNRKWDGTIGGDAQFGFAAATDIPVTGDWNGDGKTDVGVFRLGTFYIDLNANQKWDNTTGGDAVHGFSAATDIPLAGAWGPQNVSQPVTPPQAVMASVIAPTRKKDRKD